MKLLRGTTRLVLLVLTTAIQLFVFGVGNIFLSSFRRAELSWRNLNFRTWSRVVVRLLNINLEVTNQPPTGSFLLVSNHLSYIDIVLLAAQVDCTFIAKSEVSAWPIIGPLARWFNTVFINRTQRRDIPKVLEKMKSSLDSGLGLVLFAEGTSTAGVTVAPFRSALLELASRQKLPVHYASISYATYSDADPAETSVCWWRDMTFADHLFRLLQLKGFDATLTFGDEPIVAGDRRTLASKLWHAVNAQFIPVVSN